MIREFRPENIMISNFGAKKLPNSGMARFFNSQFDGKSYSTSSMLLDGRVLSFTEY